MSSFEKALMQINTAQEQEGFQDDLINCLKDLVNHLGHCYENNLEPASATVDAAKMLVECYYASMNTLRKGPPGAMDISMGYLESFSKGNKSKNIIENIVKYHMKIGKALLLEYNMFFFRKNGKEFTDAVKEICKDDERKVG